MSLIFIQDDEKRMIEIWPIWFGIDLAGNNETITETKKEEHMNYSTTVFLTHPEKVRAIKVSYEVDTDSKKHQRYILKTFDKSIKIGDYVVVPTSTRHGMTVCKVEEVDVRVEIDSPTQLKWVVSKFNNVDYLSILKCEEENKIKIQNAEALKKQKDLVQVLQEAINGTFDEIKQLPHLSTDPVTASGDK